MITVNYRYFLAANVFASTEETRYYLNGVLIEPCDQGGVLLVATDGHRMCVIHDEHGTCDEPAIVSRLLPKAKLRKSQDATLMIDKDSAKMISSDGQDLAGFIGNHLVDGTFPDWRRVWPQETESADFSVNAAYVGDFAKIAKILEVPPIVSMQGGDNGNAIWVSLGVPYFHGIVMPVRDRNEHTLPDWIALPTPQEVCDRVAAE